MGQQLREEDTLSNWMEAKDEIYTSKTNRKMMLQAEDKMRKRWMRRQNVFGENLIVLKTINIRSDIVEGAFRRASITSVVVREVHLFVKRNA